MGETKTDMHEGWLHLEQMMAHRHGNAWALIAQGMQAAYYMGGMAALRSHQPGEELWRQCETGMQDALHMPTNKRFTVTKE